MLFRHTRRTFVLALIGLLTVSAGGAPAQQGRWVLRAEVKDPDGQIGPLAFSPDGATLVTTAAQGSGRPVLRLWSVAQKLSGGQNLVGHKDAVVRLGFSADGKRLVSISQDGVVARWDAVSGKTQGVFTVARADGQAIQSVWLSASGNVVAVQPPAGFTGFSTPVPPHVHLWDVANGKPLKSQKLPTSHRALALSPDAKTLVSAASMIDPLLKGPAASVVRLWDVASGKPSPPVKSTQVVRALFSPNGKTLVLQRLDAANAPELVFVDLLTNKAHEPSTAALRKAIPRGYSADGKLLLTVSGSRRSVAVWNVATETAIAEPIRLETPARAAALSGDGRSLAIADEDDVVRLWTYEPR